MKKRNWCVFLVVVALSLSFGCAAKHSTAKTQTVQVADIKAAQQVQTAQATQVTAPAAVQQTAVAVSDYIKTQQLNDVSRRQLIAGKLCWTGEMWERQVVTYNNAAVPTTTHPVWQYVATLPSPGRTGAWLWEPIYYRLYDATGNIIGKTSNQVAIASIQQPVAPTVVQQAAVAPAVVQQAPALQATVQQPCPPAAKPVKKKVRKPYSNPKCAEQLKALGMEVADFQKKYDLRADGKLGPATCAAVAIASKGCVDSAPAKEEKKSAAANPKAPAVEKK